MVFFAAPVSLTSHFVTLTPLSADHHDRLVEAVSDGEVWRLWYTSVPAPDQMATEISRRLALRDTGSMNPWTVLDAHGRVLGMTTFMNIDEPNRRLEIGSTWLRASAHGTGANPATKRLLLG